MIEIIFILIVVLVALLYTYYKTYKVNSGLLKIKQYESVFTEAVKEFELFTNGTKYFNNKKYEDWNETYKYLIEEVIDIGVVSKNLKKLHIDEISLQNKITKFCEELKINKPF